MTLGHLGYYKTAVLRVLTEYGLECDRPLTLVLARDEHGTTAVLEASIRDGDESKFVSIDCTQMAGYGTLARNEFILTQLSAALGRNIAENPQLVPAGLA